MFFLGPVVAFFGGIVAFFSSPLGKWVGIAILGVAVFFAGDIRGRRIANEKCARAAQAAQAAANQQDTTARTEVDNQSSATIDELRGQKEQADGRVAQLEAQLRGLPLDAPCLYGADGKPATRRVRNDGVNPGTGTGDAGPTKPAGVPATDPKAAGKRGR